LGSLWYHLCLIWCQFGINLGRCATFDLNVPLDANGLLGFLHNLNNLLLHLLLHRTPHRLLGRSRLWFEFPNLFIISRNGHGPQNMLKLFMLIQAKNQKPCRKHRLLNLPSPTLKPTPLPPNKPSLLVSSLWPLDPRALPELS
jgi:hypothetical protein